jgi:hypothetical protein
MRFNTGVKKNLAEADSRRKFPSALPPRLC